MPESHNVEISHKLSEQKEGEQQSKARWEAVAEILDATVVRCLLVPARMASLGKWNWYLPRWLGRLLPHISIEGEEYFAARGQHPAARQIQVASTGPSGPGL